MSLQVQSSQPPTSGRRTPQIYQNFGATQSSPTPSNGNNKPSSKLSLKSPSNSDKQQSPSSTSAESTKIDGSTKEIQKSSSKIVTNQIEGTSEKVDKEKGEKDSVINGSTNGSHSEKQNGKREASPVATKPTQETPKKTEEKDKKSKETPKSSPRSTPQKQQASETVKTVDPPKTPLDVVKKVEESPTAAALATPDQKKKKETAPAEKSLITEKTFKGFTTEGEEMESLVVEPTEYEDSPMPPRTGGKTRLLKYSGVPPTRARVSPFRIGDTLGNTSVTVNLSTVSEGQSSAPPSNETSPSLDFNRPLRAISGRRGTRPISDIQFTYRKSTQSNDSVSSLNATVGSDIHNDSLLTPGPGSSRKRKAMTPESTSDALVDIKDCSDSPKRNRLDFSGFLGYVASPVTLIKRSLSRVKIHASTPVAKLEDEEKLNTCVTAEATTTTANVSDEAAKMDTDESSDDVSKKNEGVGDGSQQSTKEEQTDIPEEQINADSDYGIETPVEVKDVTNKQRPFCVVM